MLPGLSSFFAAYGLSADGKVPPVIENKTLTEAINSV